MAKELKYLFFDTEMSGCDQIVSVGYLLTDGERNKIRDDYYLIKPNKAIRKSTIAIHGITTSQAKEEGITLRRGMARLNNAFKDANLVVGFAPQNDILAVAIACKRISKTTPLMRGDTLVVDVARLGTPFMLARGKIEPGQTPSLASLYAELFDGREYQQHNALSDAVATAECFWKLMDDGWFNFQSIITYYKIKHLCECAERPAKTKETAPVTQS